MTIEAILFDKDGTLLDFHATWLPVYGAAARRFADGDPLLAERLLVAAGYDPSRGVIAAGSLFAAGNNEEIAACFAEVLGVAPTADMVSQLDSAFTAGGADSAVAVADLPETLGSLKARGYRLGVATSDSAAGAAASLTPFGVLPLFDFVAGYDSGHGVKPGPGMVLGFCRHLGVAPAAVAVVGDNSHDMEMARAAGAALRIGVLTGTSSRNDLAAHADHVLDSISGLEALLDSLV